MAVIGNGASAVQIVEGLYKTVNKLFIFQRSAKWLMQRPITSLPRWFVWCCLHLPFLLRLLRWVAFWWQEALHLLLAGTGPLARWYRARFTRKRADQIRRKVPHAESRGLVPQHRVGCNRIIIYKSYLDALASDQVETVNCGGDGRRLQLTKRGVSVVKPNPAGDLETGKVACVDATRVGLLVEFILTLSSCVGRCCVLLVGLNLI